MRFDFALIAATLISTAAAGVIEPQRAARMEVTRDENDNDLFKRKGGGGGGGRGGGGGSSGGSKGGSSSSGGSKGGSSSGSSGSGSSGSGSKGGSSGGSSGSGGFYSRGNTQGSSNRGGYSAGGTGPAPRFGGGNYYGGGARTPYRSGATTAAGIGAVALGASALYFWPGHIYWPHGANLYPYRNTFTFDNATSNKTETLPVVCGCGKYDECSCDENKDTVKELVGNGSYAALNKSLINVAEYKNRKSILINGTLPNGTTADGPNEGAGAGVGMKSLVEAAGMWPAVVFVLAAVFTA